MGTAHQNPDMVGSAQRPLGTPVAGARETPPGDATSVVRPWRLPLGEDRNEDRQLPTLEPVRLYG